jgi:hypothetical protein
MNILSDISGGINNINNINEYELNMLGDEYFRNLIERNIMSNMLLNNQNNNSLNNSFNEISKYKNVLSEKGRKKLKTKKYRKNSCTNDTCVITQEKFKTNDDIIVLPCKHGFKKEILEWLENEHAECPVCRMKLDSKEIKKNEDSSIETSRYNFLNSLNILNSINGYNNRNINISFSNYPNIYGTNGIDTIANSYIDVNNEEEMINQAISNSLNDISNNY